MLTSEAQRHQQAHDRQRLRRRILAVDPNANVVVLGDLNDFEFSPPSTLLEGGVLTPLMRTLPQDERYSYVFEGNSQSLDHILVSDGLFGTRSTFDVSTSTPSSSIRSATTTRGRAVPREQRNDRRRRWSLRGGRGLVPVTADGNWLGSGRRRPDICLGSRQQRNVRDAGSVGDLLRGRNRRASDARTVGVRVTDGTSSATDTAQVTITNVPPTATFVAPATVNAGNPFTLALTNPADPSAADVAAGFTYAFDCGSGATAAFGAASTRRAARRRTSARSRSVAKIRDKDGGVTEYRATVRSIVTVASLCALTEQFVTNEGVANSHVREAPERIAQRVHQRGQRHRPTRRSRGHKLSC